MALWKCNYKHVKLYRLFGHWPIEGFKDIDSATETQFWADTDTSNEALRRWIIDIITKTSKDMEMKSGEGEFQPLGYWKNLGYDVDMIKENTPLKDQKDHRQLGKCYRVVIEKDKKQKIECMVRSMTLSNKRAPKSGEHKGGNM